MKLTQLFSCLDVCEVVSENVYACRGGEWYFKTMDGSGTIFVEFLESSSNYVHLTICTVLCKSNANDNRRILHFVLAIYRRYISETSHGLPNVKTINHRDIGTIFAISRRDIVLARLRCNDISQSK